MALFQGLYDLCTRGPSPFRPKLLSKRTHSPLQMPVHTPFKPAFKDMMTEWRTALYAPIGTNKRPFPAVRHLHILPSTSVSVYIYIYVIYRYTSNILLIHM